MLKLLAVTHSAGNNLQSLGVSMGLHKPVTQIMQLIPSTGVLFGSIGCRGGVLFSTSDSHFI